MVRAIDETVVLVTGSTDGLGRAVAEQLARDGATVHLHGRDPDRLATAAREIVERTANERIATHLADLASLEAVRGLADDVAASTERLDVLINNAGIGAAAPDLPTRQESRDGHELRFAVNYLAGFLLTMRLLPLLRRSTPARIVHVASLAQARIDFDDVMLERDYDGARAYSQSKLAQITSGFELAERLAGDQITVTSLHPGTFMPTKIVLESIGRSVDTIEGGVRATVRLATSPELEGVSGRFYDREAVGSTHRQADDRDARRRLWELSVRLTGEPGP